MNTLVELYEKAVSTFSQEAEINELRIFGSQEKNQHDCYSDLDLQVITSDFDTTMTKLPALLAKIGDYFIKFPLGIQEGYAAYTVLFKDYALYNKLDINIQDPTIKTPFAENRSVYRQVEILPFQPSTYTPAAMEPLTHSLYDAHIGAIRYAKYRKRKMHLTAYRFYRAQVEHYFLHRYHQLTQDTQPQHMGTLEYQILDKLAGKENLQQYIYPANEHTMNAYYCEILSRLIDEAKMQVEEQHIVALQEILVFVRQELLSEN